MISLKFFRKPTFSLLMSTMFLIFSCSRSDIAENQKSFDYSIYANHKDIDLKKYQTNSKKKNSSARIAENFQTTLTTINNDFNTDLTINNLDDQLLSNQDLSGSFDYLQPVEIIQNYITTPQKNLCETMLSDIESSGFDVAMQNFEQTVISMNISDAEFQKYNQFANVLYLLHNSDPSMFQNSTSGKIGSTSKLTSCQKAIIYNALATVGLVSCGTGWLCALAIASKLAAMESMIDSCTN